MSKKKLHPSIEQFKSFVKSHPSLVKEVRQGKTTWQELYEEWYLLGENDPKWDTYKEKIGNVKVDSTSDDDSKSKMAFLNNIMNKLKNADINQIQQYLASFHDAIGTAQQLLSQFQDTQGNEEKTAQEQRPNPFSFRKD